MAKTVAERGTAEVKNSQVYKVASSTIQEQVTNIKQTESFQQLKESQTGQFISSFAQNLKENIKQELQQSKSGSRLR